MKASLETEKLFALEGSPKAGGCYEVPLGGDDLKVTLTLSEDLDGDVTASP